MPVIPAFRTSREGDLEFKLGWIHIETLSKEKQAKP